MVISFILFLTLYIQGNYFSGNLPRLDGSIIDWSQYSDEELALLREQMDAQIILAEKGTEIYNKDGIIIKWLGFYNYLSSITEPALMVSNPLMLLYKYTKKMKEMVLMTIVII